MNVFRDGVIAFFSAVGMTTVVWLLAGALLHAGRPAIPGLLLVLPARGDAPALEHDVRELRRVQGSLPGAINRIVFGGRFLHRGRKRASRCAMQPPIPLRP